MKARAVFLVALALLLAGCGGSASDHAASSTTISALKTVTIGTSGGKKVGVRVEIADDRAEQERGLMGRTALAEDRGMLFVFPYERGLSFWMKDTLIPLSIAYMDSQGRIVDIQDMKPLDTTSHPSSEPAKYALEVNKGFFREHGVEEGDKAELPV